MDSGMMNSMMNPMDPNNNKPRIASDFIAPSNYYGFNEYTLTRPYSSYDRIEIFDNLNEYKLNCYLYNCYDDLNTNINYKLIDYEDNNNQQILTHVINECNQRKIHFIYTININDFNNNDEDILISKINNLFNLGINHFNFIIHNCNFHNNNSNNNIATESMCLIINNIYKTTKTVAKTQNKPVPVIFFQINYNNNNKNNNDLRLIGKLLDKDIFILFHADSQLLTNDQLLSKIIETNSQLNRSNKIILLDSLYDNSNDYRNIYTGAYNRNSDIFNNVHGIIIQGNIQPQLNFIPLKTFSQYVNKMTNKSNNDGYDAHLNYSSALSDWNALFIDPIMDRKYVLNAIDVRMLCDFFYLPNELGMIATRFVEDIKNYNVEEFNKIFIGLKALLNKLSRLTANSRDLYYCIGDQLLLIIHASHRIKLLLDSANKSNNTSNNRINNPTANTNGKRISMLNVLEDIEKQLTTTKQSVNSNPNQPHCLTEQILLLSKL